jgi:hypothetical protein
VYIGALALLLGFSLFDMIPNSSAHYMPFVFAGALLGSTTGSLSAQMRKRAALRKMRRSKEVADVAA